MPTTTFRWGVYPRGRFARSKSIHYLARTPRSRSSPFWPARRKCGVSLRDLTRFQMAGDPEAFIESAGLLADAASNRYPFDVPGDSGDDSMYRDWMKADRELRDPFWRKRMEQRWKFRSSPTTGTSHRNSIAESAITILALRQARHGSTFWGIVQPGTPHPCGSRQRTARSRASNTHLTTSLYGGRLNTSGTCCCLTRISQCWSSG